MLQIESTVKTLTPLEIQ